MIGVYNILQCVCGKHTIHRRLTQIIIIELTSTLYMVFAFIAPKYKQKKRTAHSRTHKQLYAGTHADCVCDKLNQEAIDKVNYYLLIKYADYN